MVGIIERNAAEAWRNFLQKRLRQSVGFEQIFLFYNQVRLQAATEKNINADPGGLGLELRADKAQDLRGSSRVHPLKLHRAARLAKIVRLKGCFEFTLDSLPVGGNQDEFVVRADVGKGKKEPHRHKQDRAKNWFRSPNVTTPMHCGHLIIVTPVIQEWPSTFLVIVRIRSAPFSS